MLIHGLINVGSGRTCSKGSKEHPVIWVFLKDRYLPIGTPLKAQRPLRVVGQGKVSGHVQGHQPFQGTLSREKRDSCNLAQLAAQGTKLAAQRVRGFWIICLICLA